MNDKAKIAQIGSYTAEVEEGKWFVSMECLFAGFDYALIDPEGKSKLVQRNEASAFLTKHLRVYGVTGDVLQRKLNLQEPPWYGTVCPVV